MALERTGYCCPGCGEKFDTTDLVSLHANKCSALGIAQASRPAPQRGRPRGRPPKVPKASLGRIFTSDSEQVDSQTPPKVSESTNEEEVKVLQETKQEETAEPQQEQQKDVVIGDVEKKEEAVVEEVPKKRGRGRPPKDSSKRGKVGRPRGRPRKGKLPDSDDSQEEVITVAPAEEEEKEKFTCNACQKTIFSSPMAVTWHAPFCLPLRRSKGLPNLVSLQSQQELGLPELESEMAECERELPGLGSEWPEVLGKIFLSLQDAPPEAEEAVCKSEEIVASSEDAFNFNGVALQNPGRRYCEIFTPFVHNLIRELKISDKDIFLHVGSGMYPDYYCCGCCTCCSRCSCSSCSSCC